MAASIYLDKVSVWREGTTRAPRLVVDKLSLDVDARERIALIGPNGAGKTSLLLAMVGAVPFEGRIAIGDRELTRKSLGALRRDVGFVFAEPGDQLFLPSVRDEVAFGPRQRGVPEAEIAARVADALAAVGLQGFDERTPGELSLGEQRRLAFATVLSYRPGVVLCDEPTASLDPLARKEMLATLSSVDATLVFATHDLDGARNVGARAVLMRAGRMVAAGAAEDVLSNRELLVAAGLDAS